MSRARLLLLALMTGTGVVAACGSSDAGPGATSQAGTGGAGGDAGSANGGKAGSTAGGGSGAGTAGKGGTGPSGGTTAGGEAGAIGEGGAAGAMTEPDLPPYAEVKFPAANPFTDDKAMLGKILFWDEQMSGDGTMACGTCHHAESGGSDPRAASPSARRHPGADGKFGTDDDIHGAMGMKRCQISGGTVTYKTDPVFGTGVQVTRRKPPSYLDAMFAPAVFWDGRAAKFVDPDDTATDYPGTALEAQVLGPPVSDAEMACESRTWQDIATKLQAASPLALAHVIPLDIKEWITARLDNTGTYPALFKAVYGTSEVSAKRIAFAIATHERRLMSNHTPWDRFKAGDTTALTTAQQHGFSLIQSAGCQNCHSPPSFSDGAFHNLGFVPIGPLDLGRYEVTKLDADKGRVKTATLRNVSLREAGGLLHYGFGPGATLDDVMASYNVPPIPKLENTDPLIVPLNLTAADIADMIDAMRNGLLDPRVKNALPPFDHPQLDSEQ